MKGLATSAASFRQRALREFKEMAARRLISGPNFAASRASRYDPVREQTRQVIRTTGSPNRPFFELAAKVLLTAIPLCVQCYHTNREEFYDAYGRGRARRSAIARGMA